MSAFFMFCLLRSLNAHFKRVKEVLRPFLHMAAFLMTFSLLRFSDLNLTTRCCVTTDMLPWRTGFSLSSLGFHPFSALLSRQKLQPFRIRDILLREKGGTGCVKILRLICNSQVSHEEQFWCVNTVQAWHSSHGCTLFGKQELYKEMRDEGPADSVAQRVLMPGVPTAQFVFLIDYGFVMVSRRRPGSVHNNAIIHR